MSSTVKARVLGKKREKKRRRLILSGSDEDDDNIAGTSVNKGLDESGDVIKVEAKGYLGLEASVKQVEAYQNGVEDDNKKIEGASQIKEKCRIEGSTHIEEEVKVESKSDLSSEAVVRMEVDDSKEIVNAASKKETNVEYEIVSRSEDVKKQKETNASVNQVEAHQNGVEDDSKKVDGASLIKEKCCIEGSTHIEEEVKVESKTGLSSEAVVRMEVDDSKEIENAASKKETDMEYEIVPRSKVVKKQKETNASRDSCNGSSSAIKTKNSLDCSTRKDAMKIDAKKILKTNVGHGRDEADSKKFSRSDHGGSSSTSKKKNSVDQRSGKEVMKVEMKKVLKSKDIKEREEAGTNEKSPGFSVSSWKTKIRALLDKKKVKYKKVLKSTAFKEREVAEFEKEKAAELGSKRKRSREALEDEIYSKKFRSEHVRRRQQLSSEPGEMNMKRKSLKPGYMGDDKRQRDESDEKSMQEDLNKKNETESENAGWMERSTARRLRKLKDNCTSSGGGRSNDGDTSQRNRIRAQGKHGASMLSSRNTSEIDGFCKVGEDKESKKFTGNHPLLFKERKFEKPISTVKNPTKVSVPEAKTAKGASSPAVSSKKVTSSNITTDSNAKGETRSKSKASVLTKPNSKDEGRKGGNGGSGKQRTAKQKVRDEIKGILVDAGWTIDLRPRKGRDYEDSVYIPPTGGGGFWSITKAYAKYMEYCKGNALSEKQSKKTTGGDHDHEGTTPTFAIVPSDLVKTLTRNVVNKRRSREEIERDEMLGVRKGRVRREVNGVNKVRNKRRGCALLVRGANAEAKTDDDDYVPYIWKRTIMSWMIDLGVLQLDGKVKYMNKKQTRALLEGSVTRDGIRCCCCSKIISVAKFEIHAGSKLRQPYQNIIVEETGDSLLQCQLNAWEKQDESDRQGFYIVDTDGDDPNDDTCGLCGDGGDLICCDGCPSTFHLNCLDIEMLPTGEWYCTNCSCRYCGLVSDAVPNENDSDISTLLTCLQCEKKYHFDCIPDADVISLSSNDSDSSFCGISCKKVFKKLQKLIGTKNDLETGLSWRLIRRFGEESSGYPCSLPKRAECNSKVAVAFAVMDECFCPIMDYRSGINLIHNVVYNCGSNINRLSYTGFYTFVLERGDEIIAVASVRIHGTRLAEMPFIGTRNMYRRQGMCRQLLSGIESALYSLNVEKLIIPAISELTETWTNIFGFKHLDLSQRQEVRTTNMLVFPGTGLLQKPILSKASTEEHMSTDACGLGASVSGEKLIPSSGSNVHRNHEVDNAASMVALGSDTTDDSSVGSASVIKNQQLLGAANESSVSSFKPKLYGADEDAISPKFEPAEVCHKEPMGEGAFRIGFSKESKSEEVTMLDSHENKDRGVADTPSGCAVNGSSARRVIDDGSAPQEAAGEKITNNVHSSGFPPDCSFDAARLHNFESTSKSSSSTVVDQGSLAANEHFVDGNHARGIHSTIVQAELKACGHYLSQSNSGTNAKLVDSLEGKDPVSFMEPTLSAVGEASDHGICDVNAELRPVKFEANTVDTVDQDTEPCAGSVNDRSVIIHTKERDASGSSVTNNSCNITEPDNGTPHVGCSHTEHMVARDSAPLVLGDSASCAFTDGALLYSSYLKSDGGPDPHVHGSVAESRIGHSAEDIRCGVGLSICMRGTASGGSLKEVVVQEAGKIAADVSANLSRCCAEGVCDTGHSEDISAEVVPPILES